MKKNIEVIASYIPEVEGVTHKEGVDIEIDIAGAIIIDNGMIINGEEVVWIYSSEGSGGQRGTFSKKLLRKYIDEFVHKYF